MVQASSLYKVVRSLDLQNDRRDELRSIDISEWPALLKLTDRCQMTLPLAVRCRDFLPCSVRDRTERNLADNAVRHERLFSEYQLIADVLRSRSIDFLLLKGFAQIAPFYVIDPRHRPQYDIDLYCPPEDLYRARDAMRDAGFAAIGPHLRNTDHLPCMMRQQGWKWRGNYFDPDLPLTLELHFRFWDPESERIPVGCVDRFWQRRTAHVIDREEIPVLCLS